MSAFEETLRRLRLGTLWGLGVCIGGNSCKQIYTSRRQGFRERLGDTQGLCMCFLSVGRVPRGEKFEVTEVKAGVEEGLFQEGTW